MRRSPFFMTLAGGVATAALVLVGTIAASAQEADIAAETSEQATAEVQAEAGDASTSANNQADSTAETTNTDSAANSDSANAGTEASVNQSSENQHSVVTPPAPAASTSVETNLNQGPANIQGRAGAQSGRAITTEAQRQLNIDQRSNVTQGQGQLNAGQSGQVGANGQLSAQAFDQRLGVQFDEGNRGANQGLTIKTIQPNSVFYSNGLRQGDVLLSIDNRQFLNQAEFSRVIAAYPQSRVPLIVLRNGQQQTLYFNRPADFVLYDQPTVPSQAVLGVTFDSSKGGAAVIRAVTPNSPAEQAGIMIDDVITALNGQPVIASNNVIEMIAAMQPGQSLTIDIARQEQKIRTDAVLAARSAPVRHSVGYAPDPAIQSVPATVGGAAIRTNRTYQALPVRPSDPDGDGRVLDGDGRIPRRILNNRR